MVTQALKISVTQRVVAKAIDFIVVVALSTVLPRALGPLLALLYSLCADSFPQSAGKKMLNLKVINTLRKGPASLKDSIIRNAPVGLVVLFAIVPVWGWIFLVLVGMPLMGIEIYLMKRIESGHRLGDVMADTEVVHAH